MAKYSRGAKKSVGRALGRLKEKKLETGSGAKVKDRKQAIAIGLSEARAKGARVPPKKGTAKKAAPERGTATKTAPKKAAPKKDTARKTASRKAHPVNKTARKAAVKKPSAHNNSRRNSGNKGANGSKKRS